MGLRFRKSIKLGSNTRVNFSKSGVGISTGIKGARVSKKAGGGTRTTLSVPGTGISYVHEERGTSHSSGRPHRNSMNPNSEYDRSSGNRKTWLWVLGWILFFPIPLSILLYRSSRLSNAVKYGLIGFLWLAVVTIAFAGGGKRSSDTEKNTLAAARQAESAWEPLADSATVIQDLVEEPKETEDLSISDPTPAPDSAAEAAILIPNEDVAAEIEEPIDRNIDIAAIDLSGTETAPYTFRDFMATKYAQTDVNVRSLPEKNGDQIGTVRLNQEVAVTGQCNETGWYRINYNNSPAYVSNDYFADTPLQIQAATENNPDSSKAVSSNATAASGAAGVVSSAGSSVDVPSQSNTNGANLVWVPVNGGTKYHSYSGCSNMVDPVQIPLEEAISRKYEPCRRCH